MENTASLIDSNSESDISDSWALIDEDSSFEWNNVVGMGPRQYILEKSEQIRTSSELSDEDSIEVVADDHTDNLSDNEAHEAKGEKWTMTENVGVLESKEEKDIPDVWHPTTQLKKYAEYTPLLITILIMSIVGGITVGYSWGSYASQPHAYEDSASIQSTRALLAKLQNENLFLQSQLRLAHSSLNLDAAKVPKVKASIKLDVHKKTKEKPSNVDYPEMCTITDFILQSSHHDNVSKDFCLATDRPYQNEHVWSKNVEKANTLISSVDLSLSKDHVEMINTKINSEPNGSVTIDAKQVNKTSPDLSEISSFIPFDEGVHNKDSPHPVEHVEGQINMADFKNSEGGTDPRPYTKLRTFVENVYTILSLVGNDIQTAFPSKLELLSIFPQMAVLDFSMESLTSDNYQKITAFKGQIQDAAQKLCDDIETSVNNLLQNIAHKLKKFEMNNTKQTCKLKRILERSSATAHVDWNTKPFFQKCIEYQQRGNDNEMRGMHKVDAKDPLSEDKEQFLSSAPTSSDYEKSDHKHRIEREQGDIHPDYNQQKKNMQQAVIQNGNFESKERLEKSYENYSEARKQRRKIKKIYPENKRSKKYNADIQQQEINVKYENKKDKPEKETRRKKRKEDGMGETDVRSDFNDEKHNKKKTFDNNKEKNVDRSNKEHKKGKKDKKYVSVDEASISGEWALKMAHGREEHRRRDHRSDWLFDRAESRKSSRGKNNKEPYWQQDYTGKFFNSDMCNKTKIFKDQASKAWKDVKHRVKENVWRPIVDTAKTAKRAFNEFNNYHSRRE